MVKDWYNRLLKKYITHKDTNENERVSLKLCRIEYLNSHIYQKNSYLNIRKTGILSSILSSVFDLKHDLYLTEERNYYCGLRTSNRYKDYLKVDFQGHFLLCTGSKS